MQQEDRSTKYLVYYELKGDKEATNVLDRYEENGMHEAKNLLTDRLVLRKWRTKIVAEIHDRVNTLRTSLNLEQLALTDELNAVAKAAWDKRVDIPDGFVAIPGCKFESTAAGAAATYGCLVYYTPRSNDAHFNSLPEAVEEFWTNDGIPMDLALQTSSGKNPETHRYFPADTGAESYTYPGNAVFEENQAKFRRQLLNPHCTSMGLHLDMVQADQETPRNLTCLVAIFDAPVADEVADE